MFKEEIDRNILMTLKCGFKKENFNHRFRNQASGLGYYLALRTLKCLTN